MSPKLRILTGRGILIQGGSLLIVAATVNPGWISIVTQYILMFSIVNRFFANNCFPRFFARASANGTRETWC